MFEKEKSEMVEKIIEILQRIPLNSKDIEEAKGLLDKITLFSNVTTHTSGRDEELRESKYDIRG